MATPPAPNLLSPSLNASGLNPGSVTLKWALNADPNGYSLSSYLLIKKRTETWDTAGPGDLGANTSYTKSLDPNTVYDWAVAEVDWSMHTSTWYQFSQIWSFTTDSNSNTSNGQIGFRKPVDNLRDYNGTYQGVVGTGTQDYTGGTLYRDSYTSGNYGYEGIGSHPGVDIPVRYVPVYPSAYGQVVDAGYNGNPSLGCGNIQAGWGNRVIIKATAPGIAEPFYIVYGHLSQIDSWVQPGVAITDLTRKIGTSGNTGNSCGAHLHFQIDRNTLDSAGSTLVSHPYFPADVNAPDINGTVTRYTYDPLYLIQSLMSAFPAATGTSSQTSQTPDQIAIAEIQARAASDQRFQNLANGTNLGRDATWGQGGQPGDLTNLTWLVYNFSGGRQVQIFHAVANNNQNLRYTTYFDPDKGGWANWQQAK